MALIPLIENRDHRITEYGRLLLILKYKRWQSIRSIRLQMEILATVAAEQNTVSLLEGQAYKGKHEKPEN